MTFAQLSDINYWINCEKRLGVSDEVDTKLCDLKSCAFVQIGQMSKA